MSHRLEPHDGRPYLAPREVAPRLKDEFAFCEVDSDQGQDDVGDILAKLIELKAPQAIIDEVIDGRASALRVIVADDAVTDNFLSLIVRQNDGPLIGYHSAQHEAACRSLVIRCADALNYTVTLL
jgi:hypothetical protein